MDFFHIVSRVCDCLSLASPHSLTAVHWLLLQIYIHAYSVCVFVCVLLLMFMCQSDGAGGVVHVVKQTHDDS